MEITHLSELDRLLMAETIRLYEHEPDLQSLPAILFDTVTRLIDADVVAYSEFHHRSKDFRALVSVDDDPAARGAAMAAYARHMHSHPFWQNASDFFDERALRESDFFDDETYLNLPIVKEAFLPSQARRIIKIVIEYEDYALTITGFRVTGRSAFGDLERDRLQAFRPHIVRSYRQAQERTLAKLTPTDRLRIAFPQLTGAGGLTKDGTGTLTLSGVNTYTGITEISNGTLALSGSGSIAASSFVLVDGATTFDISGTTSGASISI